MDAARTIAGIVLVVAGLVLIVVSFFAWPAAIYGVPLLIIGILLLINAGNEDKIEQIKGQKLKRKENKR